MKNIKEITIFDDEKDGIRARLNIYKEYDKNGEVCEITYHVIFSNGDYDAEEWLDSDGNCVYNWEDNGYAMYEGNDEFDAILDEFDESNEDSESIAKDVLITLRNTVRRNFRCEHCGKWVEGDRNQVFAKMLQMHDTYIHSFDTWCDECREKDAVVCEACGMLMAKSEVFKKIGDTCFCSDCDEKHDINCEYNLERLCGGKITINENAVEGITVEQAKALAEFLRDNLNYPAEYAVNAKNNINVIDNGDFEYAVSNVKGE